MEDNKLEFFSGKSLKEFNTAEARGWVIDRMNQIESRLNSKITEFFEPDDEKKFKKVVLNSSVISIGGKLKILANCELIDSKLINKIRELSSIRNGFAHSILGHGSSIIIKEHEDGSKSTKGKESYHFLEVMNAQGKLKSKKVHKHLERFHKLYHEIREAL